MFTGIIESISIVESINIVSGRTHVTIHRPPTFSDLKIGSSVACNGICLTVIALTKDAFTVEIMQETIKKTTAGIWKKGDTINLERALILGQRLDGHWVQGHVDTMSCLLETKTVQNTIYLTFVLPSKFQRLVVEQGSIAINGVSLTVADLKSDRFTIALIGHTIDQTNLSKLVIGNKVNVEFDIIGKYILNDLVFSKSKDWINEL